MTTFELQPSNRRNRYIHWLQVLIGPVIGVMGLVSLLFMLTTSTNRERFPAVAKAAPALVPLTAPPTVEPGFVPQVFATQRTTVTAVAVGDLNGDGFLDLAVGNENARNEVYLNDSTGSFDAPKLLPFGPDGGTELLAVGDMDGNGTLDIIIGNSKHGNFIYFNNSGSGDFSQAITDTFGSPVDKYTALAIGDMDGDARYDLVVGRDNQPNLILYNQDYSTTNQIRYNAIYTATHRFNPTNVFTFGLEVTRTQSLALGHLNDDEFLDIVVGTKVGNDALYLGKGAGQFITRALTPLVTNKTGTSSVVLGDFDGDSDLDVVVAYPTPGSKAGGERLALYRNDGDGNLLACGSQLDPEQDRKADLKDINGDGKLDIMLGPKNVAYFDTALLNDGKGNILPCKPNFGTGIGSKWNVAAGDVDGDGALDLFYGIEDSGWFNRILLNDGYGDFSTRMRMPIGPGGADSTHAVAIADMNGDGSLDLVTGNAGRRSAIYLNTSVANFVNAPSQIIETLQYATPGGHNIWSTVVGDINQDGYLDIVAGRAFDASDPQKGDLIVFVNDQQGYFLEKHFNPIQTQTVGLAVGNLDDDGFLEVITANRGKDNLIYYNLGRNLENTSPMTKTFGTAADNTYSVAVGDLDHDGNLDIIAGNNGQESIVYFSKNGQFPPERAIKLPGGKKRTVSVAVGDVNNDGYLDIITGNRVEPSVVFVNDGHGGFPEHQMHFFAAEIGGTQAVALGDMNNDGALDIVMGNFDEVNYVFSNDGYGNFPVNLAYPIDSKPTRTYNVAVGDINGDGFQDIVAGNWNTIDNAGKQNALYLNDGTGKFTTVPFTASDYTRGVALGDLNNNGTLDIVIGNRYQDTNEKDSPAIAVYFNPIRSSNPLPNLVPVVAVSRPVTTANANFHSSAIVQTSSIITMPYSLHDQRGRPISARLIRGCYARNGSGGWRPAMAKDQLAPDTIPKARYGCPYAIDSTVPPSTTQNSRQEFYWDTFASGLFGQSAGVVFRIEAYPDLHPITNSVPGPYQLPYVTAVTFPFRVQGTQAVATFNGSLLSDATIYKAPNGGTARAEPVGGTLEPVVPEPAANVAGGQSEGTLHAQSGDYLVAIWPRERVTETTALPFKAYAAPATLPMTLAMGITTTTSLTVPDARRITEIRAWVDLTHTQGISAAVRLISPRGTQVTLIDGLIPTEGLVGEWISTGISRTTSLTATHDQLANGAWTLRIVLTTTTPLTPVVLTDWGIALRLSPVFLTSATPNESGLTMKPVESPGIQPLTLTLSNTLTLFDLNVALEWDATADEELVKRVKSDMERASALLYDWSNGQIALGHVNIYHDGKRNQFANGANAWNEADVRIYASNRLRPNADQGGVVSAAFSETVTNTQIITYTPGQVRMGVEWNRYGEATGNLGDDWARAFAHELSHYLLFLDDNYIGLDKSNASKTLVTISDSQCAGAMNNPYSDLHSEFHPTADWKKLLGPGLRSCLDTFSHQNVGRADWETIHRFYPWITPPNGVISQTNPGPAVLPLPVTELSFVPPLIATQPVTLPIFYLYEGSKPYYASPRARAFLRQTQPDDQIIDLGQPTRDQVFAYGARPGDTLCVFEMPTAGAYLQNCIPVKPGVDQIHLSKPPQWQPAVKVVPIGSTLLRIEVTLPYTNLFQDGALHGQLYPTDAPALEPFDFAQQGNGNSLTFGKLLDTLDPVLEGHIRIWRDNCGNGPTCEIITDFAVGGNLVSSKGRHVSSKGRHVSSKGRHTSLRARHAPVSSSDGQVVVYIDDKINADTQQQWLFTIQPAAALNDIPPWATVVGKAYWLHVFPPDRSLSDSSLSFEYLGSDVSEGIESSLRLFRWDEQAQQWDPLKNQFRDIQRNVVSAPVTEGGLYVLMAGLAIPLQPGWNLLGYPVQTSAVPTKTRSISEVLESIKGNYSVVYNYIGEDQWQIHTPSVKVSSSLTALEFGKGYWLYITATQSITLYLRSSFTETANKGMAVTPVSLSGADSHLPPTTYLGTVSPAFSPTVGMEVIARVGNIDCGHGLTYAVGDQAVGDQIVYTVTVAAASQENNFQCGREDVLITFTVNNQRMSNKATWENKGLQWFDLKPPE